MKLACHHPADVSFTKAGDDGYARAQNGAAGGAEAVRKSVEGKIRALTAQGRLQAWVVGALPAVLAALLFLVEPTAMRALIDTWQGWVVAAAVVALQAIGVALIRRIVSIDV